MKEPKDASFATIGTIYSDGVTLIFDGQTVESQKRYKVNASAYFSKGDRVRIIKDSGTYVVEYPVGNPNGSNIAMRLYNPPCPNFPIELKMNNVNVLKYRMVGYDWYNLSGSVDS